MTVLLHKANLLRRRHWQTETLIVEDNGALRALKRWPSAQGPAPGNLGTLTERHARLAEAQNVVGLPALLEVTDTELTVEYVAGQTSLGCVERCLYERRFAAAAAEVEEVLALLDRLPSLEVNPYDDERYVAALDPERRALGDGPERCLLPGLYDFGLGNLVVPDGGGPRVVVDWEWTTPWPVPAAFVGFVCVRNTAEYLQPMIRALTSAAFPGLVFFDDIIIPEAWARAAGLDATTVARFLAMEVSLQRWIHITHRPLERFVLHAEPKRVTERADENAALLAGRLRAELADERAQADALRGQALALEAELHAGRRMLADLGGARYATRHVARLLRDRLPFSR
jgi:hypothetical protein